MGCAWQLQEVLHEGLERLSPAVNKKVAESPHAALPTVKDRLQASNRESITKDTAYRARRHRRQLQRRFAVAGARCITRAGFELRVELKWPNGVLWD